MKIKLILYTHVFLLTIHASTVYLQLYSFLKKNDNKKTDTHIDFLISFEEEKYTCTNTPKITILSVLEFLL